MVVCASVYDADVLLQMTDICFGQLELYAVVSGFCFSALRVGQFNCVTYALGQTLEHS